MSEIKSTTLRFYLDKPIQKKAWDYLQGMDKSEYSSYSQAIAESVSDYFDRKHKIQADPYFENREREEKFIGEIIGAIETALEKYIPVYLAGLTGAIKMNPVQETDIFPNTLDKQDGQNEDINDLIDFDFLGG